MSSDDDYSASDYAFDLKAEIPSTFNFFEHPPQDPNWKCYLFGSTPANVGGLCYIPPEGQIPNRFIRWCMKHTLGCTWVWTADVE